MFTILSLYSIVPLLSHLASNKYHKTLWYIVIIYIIFNSILQPLLSIFGIEDSFLIPFDYATIYFILGYLLSNKNFTKKERIIVYILGITSCVIRYSYTIIASLNANKIVKDLFDYGQFPGIFLSIAIFVFIRNINYDKIKTNSKICKILANLSSCSFGIFLIHKLIMRCETHFFGLSIYSYSYRTFYIIITYLVSLIIVWIMKKIPVIKKIVP